MENGLSEEEKLIELKLQFLQENLNDENISYEVKKMPYDKSKEFQIIFSFPQINGQNEENIKFVLLINLTRKKMHLYSLNLLGISDGRDLLPFITQTNCYKFNFEDLNLLNIVENIKVFLSKITEKDLAKIGRFHLGEEYDIYLISNLKEIFIKNCYHYDAIDGDYMYIPSLISISNDYLCLYEFSIEPNKRLKDIKNKFLLVFYGNIKSILSFKRSLVGSIVTITFRRDFNNKIFNLKICGNNDEEMDKIMDTLIEKIKNVGYRMNIYEKKQGQLPQINIEDTEKNITLYEEKLQNEENANNLKKLLSFYEEAIEYYSAINDNKYIEYNNKARKLLKNEKYANLLG